MVVPLLTAKIAESKRRERCSAACGFCCAHVAPAQEVQGTEGAPPPARLIGRLPASAPPQRAPSASQVAAAIAQHKLRSIKARRQYQKWSTERQERLRKEAEERAKKEAEERARREAEEKLRKEQEAARQKAEEELTRMKAADADKKRKEQDVAMAAAMEKAKADAAAAAAKAVEEAKAAAEAQLAESRRLAVEKLERDMQRPTYEGKTEEANEKEYMARSSLARASVNAGKAMPRRSSVNAMMAAAQAAQATTTAADASLDPRVAYAEGMPDMPSVPGAGDGGAVDVDGDTRAWKDEECHPRGTGAHIPGPPCGPRVISLASTSAPALTPASCARACARTLVSLATRTCSVTAPACDV